MNLRMAQNLVKYYNELIERQNMLQESLNSLDGFKFIAFCGVRYDSEHPDYFILYEANKAILIKRLELVNQEILQLEAADDKET